MSRELEGLGFAVRARRSIPFGLWPLSLHGPVVAERTPGG
jgi:hypothetical protein